MSFSFSRLSFCLSEEILKRSSFEKLKSLPSAERHLKTGVSLEQLEAQARAESDLQSAENLNAARSKLFDLMHRVEVPGTSA